MPIVQCYKPNRTKKRLFKLRDIKRISTYVIASQNEKIGYVLSNEDLGEFNDQVEAMKVLGSLLDAVSSLESAGINILGIELLIRNIIRLKKILNKLKIPIPKTVKLRITLILDGTVIILRGIQGFVVSATTIINRSNDLKKLEQRLTSIKFIANRVVKNG